MGSMKKLSMVIGAALCVCSLGLKPAQADNASQLSSVVVTPQGTGPAGFPTYPGLQSLDILGMRFTPLVTNAETGGRSTLFQIFSPQGYGAPYRINTRNDEEFHNLNGELTFTIGPDKKQEVLPQGSFIFLPEGRVHEFVNSGTTKARSLSFINYGDLENFFREAAYPVTDLNSDPRPITQDDPALVAQAAQDVGLVVGDKNNPPPPPTQPEPDFVVVRPDPTPGYGGLLTYSSRPSYDLLGMRFTPVTTGIETRGRSSITVITSPPGTGEPYIENTLNDEELFVESGALTFRLGNEPDIVAPEGSIVYLPQGIPHLFTNSGTTVARAVSYQAPGGLEGFFSEAGQLVTDLSSAPLLSSADDPNKIAAAAAKYGVKLLSSPTPVPEPSAWLGLLAFGAYLGASSVFKRKHKGSPKTVKTASAACPNC